MLDAVHESDRFGLQCCRHEPSRRAALGCNRRRGSRTPPEVQECENRGWTLWTATCRIKQAGRISGSPLEWKPVGRSDEGTPVRRQNKARLPVPGSIHAEPTGEVHTVPDSWGRLNGTAYRGSKLTFVAFSDDFEMT